MIVKQGGAVYPFGYRADSEDVEAWYLALSPKVPDGRWTLDQVGQFLLEKDTGEP
jgi:hypothetical protein